jgi:hypothetical protein
MNPKGVGINNTGSRAELAAAINHGYSHIATDRCIDLKSSCHTQTSPATTSKEMSYNPLLEQSANRHRPSTSSKLSSTQVLQAMNMLTLLL